MKRCLNFAEFIFQTPEKEPEDKNKEATSPKDTPPAGSSRRKQSKTAAQHITKDKDGKGDNDDDDIVEIVEDTPR